MTKSKWIRIILGFIVCVAVGVVMTLMFLKYTGQYHSKKKMASSPLIQKERERIIGKDEVGIRKKCKEDFLAKFEDRCRQIAQRDFDTDLKPCLKSATREDYQDWLVGFLERGGKANDVSEYPFSRFGGWYVATCDLHVNSLGSLRGPIDVIVPEGISVTGNDFGDSTFYLMDGFKTAGMGVVLIYSDMN